MENKQNEYQLTADEKGLVAPIIEQVEILQKEAQSILRAITRLRKLDGQWNLVGDKLIRADAPAPQPTPQPAPQPVEAVGANGRG